MTLFYEKRNNRNIEFKYSSERESCNMIPYYHPLAPFFIRNALFPLIPEKTEHILIMAIGSNAINGDSFGPFTGTLLSGLYPEHLKIVGNLKMPLDADVLKEKFCQINSPSNTFIIAIDSAVGPKELLHSIVVQNRAMSPGSGLGTPLPTIGDCSLSGVVLCKDAFTDTELIFKNLYHIYSMAIAAAKGISLTIRQYFHYPPDRALLPSFCVRS